MSKFHCTLVLHLPPLPSSLSRTHKLVLSSTQQHFRFFSYQKEGVGLVAWQLLTQLVVEEEIVSISDFIWILNSKLIEAISPYSAHFKNFHQIFQTLFICTLFSVNVLCIFCTHLRFFSFTVLLIIGYTIPVIGAIVRYRSIFLPFIITPVICNINWAKVNAVFHIKK